MPGAEMIYVADDAGFPYGDWEEEALSDRVVGLIGGLIGRFAPDGVVIACNTASTLVLPPLRARFALPFVGTVPAIKPAAERTRSGLVSVLATYGTMRRDYTRDLIQSFAAELRGAARRLGQSRAARRGAHARRRGLRRGDPRGDRAGLRREGRHGAPTRSCSPARITRSCSTASSGWRPGRSNGSIRRRRSPVGWRPSCRRRPEARRASGAAFLTSGQPWPRALDPFLKGLGLEAGALTLS